MKPTGTWRVGIDLVQVSRIAESLEQFGDRFLRRVLTDGEIAYAASSPASAPERFAARFAAKRIEIARGASLASRVRDGDAFRIAMP